MEFKERVKEIEVGGKMHAIEGWERIHWDGDVPADGEYMHKHMRDLNKTGLYYLEGVSAYSDGLPEEGGGEFAAWVEVANMGDNNTNILQKITYCRKAQKEAKTYTRVYKDGTWYPWQLLQPMNEVGQVESFDDFIDNGMYSGADVSSLDMTTFILIVINNYAVAAAIGMPEYRQVTQLLYELPAAYSNNVTPAVLRMRTAIVPPGGNMAGANWVYINTK